MKRLLQMAVMAVLATALGCSNVEEVGPDENATGPTADEQMKRASESLERMSSGAGSQQDPNAGAKERMMQDALRNAPGGGPPNP
jgi:hypothetical protein